jgi:hypothetical protein
MKKKNIDPKDLEVNREFLAEKNEGNSTNSEVSEDTGTLCVTKVVCAPTDKNCDQTQSLAVLCCQHTKQVNCKHTKNNCLTNICGDSNNLCQVSVNYCPQTRDNCQESVDICQQTKNNCPSLNNCDTNATCPLPATRVQTGCVKE